MTRAMLRGVRQGFSREEDLAVEALPLAVSLARPIKAKGMESPSWLDPKPTGRVSAAHGGWARVA